MGHQNEFNSVLSIREGIAMFNLSEVIRQEMEESWLQSFKTLVQSSLANSEIDALVIIINGDSFPLEVNKIGNSFNYMKVHSELLKIFSEIESAEKPVIAAIESSALDVTLELALHCHYRVVTAGAMIGFSSVKDGLIPGLGGTQLLPRLIGIEAALNMLHRSTVVEASELANSGLFDQLLDSDATTASFTLAKRIVKEDCRLPRTRDIKINLPHAQAFFDIARMNVGAIHKGNKAAVSCVDCLEAAVLQRIDKGMKFEHLQFQQQIMSYLEHSNTITNSGEIT